MTDLKQPKYLQEAFKMKWKWIFSDVGRISLDPIYNTSQSALNIKKQFDTFK